MKYLRRFQFPLMLSALEMVILLLALLTIKGCTSVHIATELGESDDVYVVVAWFLLTIFYAAVLYIGVFGTILSIGVVWLVCGLYTVCLSFWRKQVKVRTGKHACQESTRRLPRLDHLY